MTSTFDLLDADVLRPPLCSRYFGAQFDEQAVQVLEDDGESRELVVVWALGVLRCGDCEVFGAWQAADAGPAFWRGVFDELAVRGVERISFVLADAVSDLGVVCPGATVLPPFLQIKGRGYVSLSSGVDLLSIEGRRAVREVTSGRGARVALERLLVRSEVGRATVLAADWPEVQAQFDTFYALRPERRALIRRGDEVLEHLGLILNRAVRRHGPFTDVDAAVSFVGRTLTRAEAQLSSSALPVVRLPARRGDVSTARAAGLARIG